MERDLKKIFVKLYVLNFDLEKEKRRSMLEYIDDINDWDLLQEWDS